jgi:hypothetical protein
MTLYNYLALFGTTIWALAIWWMMRPQSRTVDRQLEELRKALRRLNDGPRT